MAAQGENRSCAADEPRKRALGLLQEILHRQLAIRPLLQFNRRSTRSPPSRAFPAERPAQQPIGVVLTTMLSK
jgi:hypothetical protein